jgi:hypothetical protein
MLEILLKRLIAELVAILKLAVVVCMALNRIVSQVNKL